MVPRLIGRSRVIGFVESEIDCAARSGAKVLITGETGVGKEVVARLIHDRSARSSHALATVNCAGLPDGLLESELFGHQRGSFTGAYRDKPGRLEMAPNGTMFLDEVGEMSMRMQVTLLRFLETGEIQRIGSDRPHTRVNVRLITATNRDLAKEIAAGTFREDLYFRLNVIRVHIPPLRERLEDIPLLLDYYVGVFCEQHRQPKPEISPSALDALKAHRWPGNVRELKNVVERMVLRSGGKVVQAGDLPPHNFDAPRAAVASATPVAVPGVAAAAAPQVDALVAQMLEHGESFWTVVYPLFIGRDLTRAELQSIIQRGLEATNGNYRLLVQLFNMPSADYKRFLGFLRKHDCHLPFQRFRTVPARLRSPAADTGALATAS